VNSRDPARTSGRVMTSDRIGRHTGADPVDAR
jgi:hypothetical protein